MEENIDKSLEATTGNTNADMWGFLFQTRDVIYRARGREIRASKITSMDAAILFFIHYFGDEATPVKISKWLYREHHTILAQLKRMKKKGLITTTKGIMQKNIITIKLTDEGLEALKESSKRQAIDNIFSTLILEENRQLWSILKKIRKAAFREMGKEDTLFYPAYPK